MSSLMDSVSSMPMVRPEAPGKWDQAYWLGCIVVSLISVHDAILLVVNHNVIQQVEENPIGRWLLELGSGEVWLFVGVKLFTTSLVATALVGLHDWQPSRAKRVLVGVLAFQLLLLWYLSV